jgi:hypothetical protein
MLVMLGGLALAHAGVIPMSSARYHVYVEADIEVINRRKSE